MIAALSVIAGDGLAQQVDPAAPADAGTPAVAAGDQAGLKARIDAILADAAPDLGPGRIGVYAVDLTSGDALYQRDADGAYNLASNTKILTTAAALHILGPAFRFRTVMSAPKVEGDAVVGNLWITGGADPTLETTDLRALAADLAARGIKKVNGALAVDDTMFDGAVLPPHYDSQPKEQAAFRAPVGAMNLDYNSIVVVIRPNPAGAGPAEVTLDPPGNYATLTGQVQTSATGRTRVRIDTVDTDGQFELRLGGQVSATSEVLHYRRRIADPTAFAGATLRAVLADYGIRVRKKQLVREPAPDDAVVLAEHDSAELAEVIRNLGKHSNNFTAETLLKTIGAATLTEARPATWADGLTAVRNYLTLAMGLPPGGFRYDNGSGLFDASAVSPRQLVAVLQHAWSDFRIGVDLAASLSTAGVDGTLRRRMKDVPATGRVRAKTGTLAQVTTLAGFVAVDARRPVAFAVLVNDLAKRGHGKRAGRAAQDKIAIALAEFLGAR